MSSSMGVRKGAWTQEEDILLRNCIEKHGEGKWHQVSFKAGLNRCRKSCRLRWVNYLKPDIKKGEFTEDEVDLLIRLHKLLGNRWSLIAGRIPGRTANDVKNYWNTHLLNKSKGKWMKKIKTLNIDTTLVKPQVHTFSKDLHQYSSMNETSSNIPTTDTNLSLPLPELPLGDDGVEWLNYLIDGKEVREDDGWCFGGDQENKLETFSAQQELGEDSLQDGNDWWDFSMDTDIWNFLNTDDIQA